MKITEDFLSASISLISSTIIGDQHFFPTFPPSSLISWTKHPYLLAWYIGHYYSRFSHFTLWQFKSGNLQALLVFQLGLTIVESLCFMIDDRRDGKLPMNIELVSAKFQKFHEIEPISAYLKFFAVFLGYSPSSLRDYSKLHFDIRVYSLL